jgi:hypothetical protein
MQKTVQKEISTHYFGEEFDSENGDGADMDDNVRNPKLKLKLKIKWYSYCKWLEIPQYINQKKLSLRS